MRDRGSSPVFVVLALAFVTFGDVVASVRGLASFAIARSLGSKTVSNRFKLDIKNCVVLPTNESELVHLDGRIAFMVAPTPPPPKALPITDANRRNPDGPATKYDPTAPAIAATPENVAMMVFFTDDAFSLSVVFF